MSDNRKLLELAAKAAGYVFLTNGQVCSPEAGNFDWNPLTDDADALRLAVKLDIIPHYFRYMPPEGTRLDISDTRMAIVRAAAEIGKAMEDQ